MILACHSEVMYSRQPSDVGIQDNAVVEKKHNAPELTGYQDAQQAQQQLEQQLQETDDILDKQASQAQPADADVHSKAAVQVGKC